MDSLIAISTDTRLEGVAVEVVTIRMDSPHFAELLGNAESIKDRRDQIRKLAESVLQDSREFAYYLNADGVPVRDIAELLGVSPERVSQLLKRVAAAAP